MMERALQDEFVAGIWKKSHSFPSLLWTARKPGGSLRNRNYPSWTWASIDGRIEYAGLSSGMNWEPSDATLDAETSGPSQNHVTGGITLRSTVRKFTKDYKFWLYENSSFNPLYSYILNRKYWEATPLKRLKEELMVVNRFRDGIAAAPEAKRSGGWEGAGDDIYCIVIARIGKEPPPKFGYPAFPEGRPRSLVCLCLTPVHHGEGAETEAQCNAFRRVEFAMGTHWVPTNGRF
ncbi:hypothetical protein DL766_000326 [Monosporascus sp. MC13-8B]|uniref:Uncharacterized protein n=1 Tax=Monosporascus cannonballus TaxID=155416 RepID=A0ABY0H249_9PEZI|nr:hypothetical protein DL762_007846 [Monosporascus cannonballus]RYO82388.1 hypothetical protein DL763_008239 [Monosporascus cannonballus]RYP39664.1 hypothetical protein DL766_000326 [Monosporascus sp. MC13-8B]